MQLKKILLYLTITVLTTMQLFAQNTPPVVDNVHFTIDEATALVEVTYNVSDLEEDTFTVYLEVSDDSGATWDYNYGTATGDIGENVAEGINNKIFWTYNGGINNNFMMKVIADDLCDDQIYYAGKIYNTVLIGSQVWLKENLNIGTMTTEKYQQDNGILEKFCYENEQDSCDIYGGLYQWDEAMLYGDLQGAQGICPTGWHIPTRTEFNTLKATVGGSNALKEIGQGTGDGAGTNTSGFSGLLAGYKIANGGNFLGISGAGYYWSSTKSVSLEAWYLFLYGNDNHFRFYDNGMRYGYSVRCLKD